MGLIAEYPATVAVPRIHRIMATPSEQALGIKVPLPVKRASNFKQNGCRIRHVIDFQNHSFALLER